MVQLQLFLFLLLRLVFQGQKSRKFRFFLSLNIDFLVFSYSSYLRCGWQEHVSNDNRPKVIQCQKNAVFQPTRIVLKQECVHCDKGNLLKGIDIKTLQKRAYSQRHYIEVMQGGIFSRKRHLESLKLVTKFQRFLFHYLTIMLCNFLVRTQQQKLLIIGPKFLTSPNLIFCSIKLPPCATSL